MAWMVFTGFTAIQRSGVFSCLAILVMLVVLHNPISGYVMGEVDTTRVRFPAPPASEKVKQDCEKLAKWESQSEDQRLEYVRRASTEEHSWLSDMTRICAQQKYGIEYSYVQTIEYSFDAWRTNDPLINWFGVVVNFLSSVVAVLILGLGWVLIFRAPSQ